VVTVLVIGLTGGIASGKSTIAQQLSELGAAVLDADALGHEVYQPERPAWHALREAFGPKIIGPEGEIDRKRLGSLVFADPQAMRRLTDVVWPIMKAEMAERLRQLRGERTGIVVLEAAVLLEAGWDDLVDEVWVAVVAPAVAVERLVQRTGVTATEAWARLAAQMSNSERVERADVVIENNGGLMELRKRVDECWEQVLQRA
jgi:dephospho-CoA kinase